MARKGSGGTRPAARSAITGRFVPKKYAQSHPQSTVIERVKKGQK